MIYERKFRYGASSIHTIFHQSGIVFNRCTA